MAGEQHASKTMNIILWIAQAILSASFVWSFATKFFTPIDQLAAMWPWTADHAALVKLTGVLDLLAGIGLVVPAWLRIQPRLTVYAAYGTIALMIAAVAFHSLRGEVSQIGINIFFAVLAAFIAWGRRNIITTPNV